MIDRVLRMRKGKATRTKVLNAQELQTLKLIPFFRTRSLTLEMILMFPKALKRAAVRRYLVNSKIVKASTHALNLDTLVVFGNLLEIGIWRRLQRKAKISTGRQAMFPF